MSDTEVPFYRQTLDFTCGAACIIMTISHFDPDFPLDRNSEIDIWREGTSVIALGMGRYGLSFPFLKRGFNVEVLTTTDNIDFLDRIEQRLNPRQMEHFRKIYGERKERALELGLVEKMSRQITIETVVRTLERGGIPIMLTDAKELDDDKAPHWVVVTGASDGWFSINNPLDERGNRRFPAADFERICGFDGERTVVSVFGANGTTSER